VHTIMQKTFQVEDQNLQRLGPQSGFSGDP
jgi:hypothetical protein